MQDIVPGNIVILIFNVIRFMNNNASATEYWMDCLIGTSKTPWLTNMIKSKLVSNACDLEYVLEQITTRVKECFPTLYLPFVKGKHFTLEELVAILVIHAKGNYIEGKYRTTDVHCIGHKKEKDDIHEFLEKTKSNRTVLICGPSLSGKTEFALSYLQDNKYKAAYYDYSDYAADEQGGYSAIVQRIGLYETVFLAKIDKDFLPYKGESPHTILDNSALGTNQAIVIDNFDGDDTELMKFCDLVEQNDILLMLISTNYYSKGGALSLRMLPLETDEIEQIFYELNDKGMMTEKEKQSVHMIAERVLNQAWLMRFIAKWYKHLKSKKRVDEEDVLQELEKAMNSNTITKLKCDDKFRLRTSESDAKLINHIYSIAGQYLVQKEKYTYLLLACLGGQSLPKEYLTKWLNIEAETIDELCDGGWCIEEDGGNSIKVKIPKLVAASYCRKGERKDANELRIMMKFIEKFSREIRYEEYGVIDIRHIKEMIEYVHDFCVESVEFTKKKEAITIKNFHLDCIRYYLLLCDVQPARELLNHWMEKLEIDEDNLEIQILKMRELMLLETQKTENGIRDTLLKIEELYFKSLLNNSRKISSKEAEDLCECLKIILDVLWSNLERIVLESEELQLIIVEIMDTYTNLLILVLLKWDSSKTWLFAGTVDRYEAQLEMLKKIFGFYKDDGIDIQLMVLSRKYDETMQRKKLCRLEQIEKMRFFLDYQFLLMEYVRRTPMDTKKMRIARAIQELWKQCCETMEEYGMLFPLDVIVKFKMIKDAFENLCRVN